VRVLREWGLARSAPASPLARPVRCICCRVPGFCHDAGMLAGRAGCAFGEDACGRVYAHEVIRSRLPAPFAGWVCKDVSLDATLHLHAHPCESQLRREAPGAVRVQIRAPQAASSLQIGMVQLFVPGMPKPRAGQQTAASLAPVIGRVTTAEHARVVIEHGALTAADRFFDLGCGDAEGLVAVAVQCGAQCVGVELDTELVLAARARVASSTSRAASITKIVNDDLLQVDLRSATAVYLFLTGYGTALVASKLVSELAAGSVVISRMDPVPGWSPYHVAVPQGGSAFETFYFYRVTGTETADAAMEALHKEYADYHPPLCARPTCPQHRKATKRREDCVVS